MYLFIERLLPDHKREFFGKIRLLTPLMSTLLLTGESKDGLQAYGISVSNQKVLMQKRKVGKCGK